VCYSFGMHEEDEMWEARTRQKKGKYAKKRVKSDVIQGPPQTYVAIPIDGVFTNCRMGIVSKVAPHSIEVIDGEQISLCDIDEPLEKSMRGHLVVGDRVLCKENENAVVIYGLMERSSALIRLHRDASRYSSAALRPQVVAANIDYAVITVSAMDPAFHPRFIDRYLILCQNGGINPVICLNKCDLTPERHPVLAFYRALDIAVIETSTVTGEGLEELKSFLRGNIAAFVGHSGVGKSSLVHAVFPQSYAVAGSVGGATGQGKHTTTSSSVYQWDADSYLIDTPGIRSLGIERIEKAQLRSFFPEFDVHAQSCSYRDCLHDAQPGCAVRAAAENGDISMHRYDSYCRMLAE